MQVLRLKLHLIMSQQVSRQKRTNKRYNFCHPGEKSKVYMTVCVEIKNPANALFTGFSCLAEDVGLEPTSPQGRRFSSA